MKNKTPPDLIENGDSDRLDCPPDETSKAVAHGKLIASDSFLAHLNSCRACQREFRDHKIRLEYEKMYRQAAWVLSVVLFGLVCIAIYRAYHPSR